MMYMILNNGVLSKSWHNRWFFISN